MYLERFDSHSSLVLLFNHFNQFGHNLVCNIVCVSATLKHKTLYWKQFPLSIYSIWDRLNRHIMSTYVNRLILNGVSVHPYENDNYIQNWSLLFISKKKKKKPWHLSSVPLQLDLCRELELGLPFNSRLNFSRREEA